MRDIRARIAKASGIDLTDGQIQELAARRLEAVLDVRSLNPVLMEQLRRSAGARSTSVPLRSVEAAPQLDEAALFDGGFLRRLFRPLVKLFFNPTPLIDAVNAQAKANADIARREAERDQQQLEWNALHYELLRRLVTEVSRVSLEAQGLGLRVESLSAKVDFNERRVRGLEGTVHESTMKATTSGPSPQRASDDQPPAAPAAGDGAGTTEGQRRRRRRRRGRRGNAPGEFGPGANPASPGAGTPAASDDDEGGFEDDGADDMVAVTTEGESLAASVPAPAAPEPIAPPAPSEPAAPPVAEPRADDPVKG